MNTKTRKTEANILATSSIYSNAAVSGGGKLVTLSVQDGFFSLAGRVYVYKTKPVRLTSPLSYQLLLDLLHTSYIPLYLLNQTMPGSVPDRCNIISAPARVRRNIVSCTGV